MYLEKLSTSRAENAYWPTHEEAAQFLVSPFLDLLSKEASIRNVLVPIFCQSPFSGHRADLLRRLKQVTLDVFISAVESNMITAAVGWIRTIEWRWKTSTNKERAESI